MTRLISFFLLLSLQGYTQTIQNFDAVNATDGSTLSLKNYSSKAGVVIIFHNINCPYNDYYINRIKLLAESYSGKLPVLLVNSSKEQNETVEEMGNYCKVKGISIPYLSDKDQSILNAFSARKTPEAFLLQSSGGKFKVVYRGALDDNPQTESDVTQSYLRNAMDQLLAGKKIETTNMRPIGCSLKIN